MRRHYGFLTGLVLCAGLCAGEKLVNTYKHDSGGEAYVLTLKENWSFEVTGPKGEKVTGTYVASDRKIGLLSGNLLRHFEYKLENGDLLLRPSTTDGPEPNSVLGQMPPLKRTEQYTTYLTEARYKRKYAHRPHGRPDDRPHWRPGERSPVVAPVAGADKPLTMDQMLTEAQADSQYHAYMAAGTKALSEKKFPEARAHFILAGRFKPNAPEARRHIAMCDGAQALMEGHAARKRGDLKAARHAYARAKEVSPTLSKIADAQLRTLNVFRPTGVHPVGAELERNVAQEIRQGRTATALTMTANALRSNPNSLKLRTMKEGLEGLQAAESIYGSLTRMVGKAQTQFKEIQKVEPLGGMTAKLKGQLDNRGKQIRTGMAEVRARYAENVYAGLGTTIRDARKTAGTVSQMFDRFAGLYAAQAAEAAKDDRIDLGIITISGDKGSKRADRLNGYAEKFKALSAEAAALAK